MFRRINDVLFGPPIGESAFAEPSSEELFYAKCLRVMSKPTARLFFIMRCVKLSYWLAVIVALLWLGMQVVDRRDPISIISELAEPRQVVAGAPLHDHITLVRHQRCEVTLKWDIIWGKEHNVSHFAPVTAFALGEPGPDSYVWKFATDPEMQPGPATMLVHRAFRCPGNYVSGVIPIEMPTSIIPFEVVAVLPTPSDHVASPDLRVQPENP